MRSATERGTGHLHASPDAARDRVGATLFVLLSLLLALLTADPALAQETEPTVAPPAAARSQTPAGERAAAPTDPRFLIETITVENAEKFSAEIIVAESLLVAGRSYSEKELRDASFRIIRLPLILDAEFSLRKGSERGKYELVISVWEARRWFFGYDLVTTLWSEPFSVVGLTTATSTAANTFLAGRRFSIGRSGVGFVALGGLDGTLQAGYTQYDLFGRSILLNLSYSLASCNPAVDDPGDTPCRTEVFDPGLDPSLASWSIEGDSHRAQASLSIPIEGNRSFRFFVSHRASDIGLRRSASQPGPTNAYRFRDRDDLDTSFSWVFNSIDDPVFPTNGRFLDAGIVYRTLDAELTPLVGFFFPFEDPSAAFRQDSEELRLRITGDRYWPITDRQSWSLSFRGSLGRSHVENLPLTDGRIVSDNFNVWGAGATVGYDMFLKRVYRKPRWRELRWENELEGFYDGTSPHFDEPDNPVVGIRASTGITYRTSWGVFRFRLDYVNSERRQ